MNVDRAIQEAILHSVQESKQPDAVSDKLIKWLDEVVSGNESIDDQDSVYRRLEHLFSAVEAEAEDEA